MYGLQGLDTSTYSYRLPLMNGLSVMMMRALLVAAMLCLLTTDAVAHKGSTAYVTIRVREATVDLTLRAKPHDLAPTLEVAAGVNPALVLYRTKRATVLKNVTAYLTLRSGGKHRCKLSSQRLDLKEARVAVLLTYRCPRRVELLELKYDLLFDAEPRHRAIVFAGEGGGASSKILTTMSRTFRMERAVSPWANASDFLVLGIEHIFTGYDHLAFLFGLLLVAGVVGREQGKRGIWPGLRYLLAIVTSFTIAHSITLVSAAMGWLSVPSRIVEPAIALSIAYVGLENLVVSVPRRRWLLTFAFGLVHGFGFAHMLTDIGLPRSGLVLSLAAFNLGVELGQLAVVALVFPLIYLLARERLTLLSGVAMAVLLAALLGLLALAGVQVAVQAPVYGVLLVLLMLGAARYGYRPVVLRCCSAIIALLGLFWLAERVLGVTLLGGHLG